MSGDKSHFSPFRAFFWPIRAAELSKFLPLLFLAFFIGFNYNILRNMKDAILVTAESSGAEVIPFIKVWGILPGAFLMTFIYSRLNNRLTRDRVFYTMISLFLVYFTLFTFVLYPLRDSLHPHNTALYFQSVLPAGFKGLIAMFRYWTFSSFYIMSELWSSAILSMLFWGFANQVTALWEAKRFYGLIAVGINCSGIASGQLAVFLTSGSVQRYLNLSQDSWYQSIILLTMIVLTSGGLILLIYRHLTRQVLPRVSVAAQKKDKVRMSVRKNFSYLFKSKYLLRVAIVVFAYNVIINLVEVIWKDRVRALFPTPGEFNLYMNQITTITGFVSVTLSLFVSGQLIRRFGWTAGALFTPVMLLITSIGFFFFLFGGAKMAGALAMFGTSPLALVVLFGSMQNCLSRASKYTLFDATKEMAFIPLSEESKLKGKAAIDGVGSRLGKSAGSLIHQGLLLIFTTVAASVHFVAFILFGVIFLWMGAVLSLGKRFKALTQQEAQIPESVEIKETVSATQ
ncbi:MAG: NTP/NDP exchange transporter [Chlamydiales bacterium]|nr:NTP/NDP exchange transporter [Chlamydiales bacterium]